MQKQEFEERKHADALDRQAQQQKNTEENQRIANENLLQRKIANAIAVEKAVVEGVKAHEAQVRKLNEDAQYPEFSAALDELNATDPELHAKLAQVESVYRFAANSKDGVARLKRFSDFAKKTQDGYDKMREVIGQDGILKYAKYSELTGEFIGMDMIGLGRALLKEQDSRKALASPGSTASIALPGMTVQAKAPPTRNYKGLNIGDAEQKLLDDAEASQTDEGAKVEAFNRAAEGIRAKQAQGLRTMSPRASAIKALLAATKDAIGKAAADPNADALLPSLRAEHMRLTKELSEVGKTESSAPESKPGSIWPDFSKVPVTPAAAKPSTGIRDRVFGTKAAPAPATAPPAVPPATQVTNPQTSAEPPSQALKDAATSLSDFSGRKDEIDSDPAVKEEHDAVASNFDSVLESYGHSSEEAAMAKQIVLDGGMVEVDEDKQSNPTVMLVAPDGQRAPLRKPPEVVASALDSY
jgi:hypothetical protein